MLFHHNSIFAVVPSTCQEPAGGTPDQRPRKKPCTAFIQDAVPALAAAESSSTSVGSLTKEQVEGILSNIPNFCFDEPGAKFWRCACSRTYKSASGLVQHLLAAHNVHMDLLAGSKLISARSFEFAKAKGLLGGETLRGLLPGALVAGD